MGKKITIDSATLMNKALEIIEARWLFGLCPDRIQVLIHPQSVVHSLVEFVDGSVMAQLGVPDMRLPIQYALTYPERTPGPAGRLDLACVGALRFEEPSAQEYPALELGYRVLEVGGTSGAALNAANEVAVSAFLEDKMKLTDIVPCVRDVLDRHEVVSEPSLDNIMTADESAREEARKWLQRL
jgi:1-deoxy-D-xylulose-5-phosphate reductoisomerase